MISPPTYEIFAVKYTGPFIRPVNLLFPGHDLKMATHYPKVAEGITRLV